jgi:hypothetical protein
MTIIQLRTVEGSYFFNDPFSSHFPFHSYNPFSFGVFFFFL